MKSFIFKSFRWGFMGLLITSISINSIYAMGSEQSAETLYQAMTNPKYADKPRDWRFNRVADEFTVTKPNLAYKDPKTGESLLEAAYRTLDLRIVDLLLEKGANPKDYRADTLIDKIQEIKYDPRVASVINRLIAQGGVTLNKEKIEKLLPSIDFKNAQIRKQITAALKNDLLEAFLSRADVTQQLDKANDQEIIETLKFGEKDLVKVNKELVLLIKGKSHYAAFKIADLFPEQYGEMLISDESKRRIAQLLSLPLPQVEAQIKSGEINRDNEKIKQEIEREMDQENKTLLEQNANLEKNFQKILDKALQRKLITEPEASRIKRSIELSKK